VLFNREEGGGNFLRNVRLCVGFEVFISVMKRDSVVLSFVKSTGVSENHVAPIFRVEQLVKQENYLLGYMPSQPRG
jgi:hypothetical protein